MSSPALALSRQLWRRHRLGLAAVLLYVLIMAVVFSALPSGEDKAQHAAVASIQFVAGLIYVAAVFAYGFDTRLEAPQSGFPARLFTLPVPTGVLVAAPMLQGTAGVALLWLAWERFVLRPAGIETGAWSTALQAAAFVALLQALLWSPFGLPWVRVVLALVLLPLLALAPQLAGSLGIDATLLTAVYAALIPFAAAAAFVGVSCARHGDAGDWSALFRRPRSRARRPGRTAPFASPASAQLWYEARLGLLALPLMGAGFAVLFFTVTLFVEPPPFEVKEQASLVLNLLFFPALIAPFFGPLLGRSGSSSRSPYPLSSFLATRPLPVTALVAAKLKVAALSAAAAWVIAVAACAVWIASAGRAGAWSQAAGYYFRAYPPWRAAAAVLFPVFAALLLTWRLYVDNLWVGLTGRAWLLRGGAIVCGLAMTFAALFAARLMNDPKLAHDLWEALPWLAGTAAVVKLLAAGWVGRVLLRRGLVEPRAIAKWLAVWLVAVVGLFALARGADLSDVVPVSLLASGAVLALPLVRLGAAPLALAWNRHR
jgi:hypothetical protein